MKEELAVLKEITKQNSVEITKLFEITSKLNGEYMKDVLIHNNLQNNMEQLHEKLDTIIEKLNYTNGTVRLHTKILFVVGAVAGTLLIVNGSPFVSFLTTLIK